VNYAINSLLNKIPRSVQFTIGAGLAILLALLIFYKGTQIWNGIGNFFFHRQINAERSKVQKELDSAAEQKKALEQTLIELAKSKEALAAASKEREIRDQIFNDKNKTAKEKVAAFEAAMQSAPVRTDPTGVSTNDLCERARSLGASQATIDALCEN
jgi:hypothetical protein